MGVDLADESGLSVVRPQGLLDSASAGQFGETLTGMLDGGEVSGFATILDIRGSEAAARQGRLER